jgi:hypothetical protein
MQVSVLDWNLTCLTYWSDIFGLPSLEELVFMEEERVWWKVHFYKYKVNLQFRNIPTYFSAYLGVNMFLFFLIFKIHSLNNFWLQDYKYVKLSIWIWQPTTACNVHAVWQFNMNTHRLCHSFGTMQWCRWLPMFQRNPLLPPSTPPLNHLVIT